MEHMVGTKNPVNRKLPIYKEFQWFQTGFSLKKRPKQQNKPEKNGQSAS